MSTSRPPSYLLGISAFYHDSAACLLRDGEIVAASQEERFTRVKGDSSFPGHAVASCLAQGSITAEQLSAVVFYDKPLLKLERLLETYLATAPRGLTSFLKAAPIWMKERLHIAATIREALGGAEGGGKWQGDLLWARHHDSHAASAFFPSPFKEAAILTVDGVGEWATATIGHGRGDDFETLREMHWPDSLGLLYSAFTYFTGFKVNEGEYKVMGLAPYGEPRFASRILDELVDLREDGSFTMNQSFFRYATGLRMTSPKFGRLFEGPPRAQDAPITQREMDLAASIQVVTEEVVLRMARTARELTDSPRLCLAGGVALNAVANGKLQRSGLFDEIWIQPAAGDCGGALGAALLGWHRAREGIRVVRPDDAMNGALLGPSIETLDAERVLTDRAADFRRLEDEAMAEEVAALLDGGKVVGVARNRMEFGPRALGSRSILADPRNPGMQSVLNQKIKFRESFRPFAPAVLSGHSGEHFDLVHSSPYMVEVSPLRPDRLTQPAPEDEPKGFDRLRIPRSHLPAITHVDGSARVQTLTPGRHPDLHRFTAAFHRRTGCPVLVNTSFNVKDEPIVADAADAWACFMRTDMDALVLGPFLLEKSDQPPWVEPPSHAPAIRPLTPSEGRRFAFTVGIAFLVLATALTLLGRSPLVTRIGFGLGAALMAAGLCIPTRLGPLERAWMRFGLLLSRITTPLLLTASWLLVITPVGLAMRLFGHRALTHGSGDTSAWIMSEPLSAEDRAMENQF